MASPTIKLNSGYDIPIIGLGAFLAVSGLIDADRGFDLIGTWQSKPDEVIAAVEYALKDAGYRHIDGAFAYGNEKGASLVSPVGLLGEAHL